MSTSKSSTVKSSVAKSSTTVSDVASDVTSNEASTKSRRVTSKARTSGKSDTSNAVTALEILAPIYKLFDKRGWTPLTFQETVWQAYLNGESGLIQVPTGSGKTFAATLAPLAEMMVRPANGLKLLYISPLRAVSRDIEKALSTVTEELGLDIRVESRTGDTSQSLRKKQMKAMPDVLLTTPESLSVLLSYKNSAKRFGNLRAVVVDEWHELLSTKRGTQTELCLARLRQLAPEVRTWAMSASLANVDEAMHAVTGNTMGRLVRSEIKREIVLKSVLPKKLATFPWAGHLGSSMVEPLVETLESTRSTLIFTNTRRQAERWYEFLCKAVPDQVDNMALHHSSLDRLTRERVEEDLKTGKLKWVVATSSLDLGVDFQPVEQVVQIGSPKSVARVVQRAGRSAHTPGGTSELVFVPTNALELLELAAARGALAEGVIEARQPLSKPYDVLAQHLVTLACGDGFTREGIATELRATAAYAELSEQELDDVLLLITQGGKSLSAYPEYQKVVCKDGHYQAASQQVARRQRLAIGTITSSSNVFLRYTNQHKLGAIDENFISKLKSGDTFTFAGRTLEFVMMKDMNAYVRASKKAVTTSPSFVGKALPLSLPLASYVRQEFAREDATTIEHEALASLLTRQRELSQVPKEDELLLEHTRTREGEHLFLYPFAGRNIHEGLAAVLALRLARQDPTTLSYTVNDYGITMLAPKGYDFPARLAKPLCEVGNLH
ncbi:MAG: ligase-associated DNA damage response DEXH box helicase [Deinococcota bacterium]